MPVHLLLIDPNRARREAFRAALHRDIIVQSLGVEALPSEVTALDLAVVSLPLLPVGLWELLGDLGIRLICVPDEEFPTLGCNVLAVRPGVCVVADGNPATRRALEAAGCEVHAYLAQEIGINGSGGPTCLTRPILRQT